jgi:aminocarboxymuconate-semialdehyde decarboxylase
MADNPEDGIEFVGCDLTYHPDEPAFAKDPTTTKSHTHRTVTINGKQMLVIDMHAHSQVPDVWPLIDGRPELHGENFFAQGPLKPVEHLPTRLAEMDRMGIDMEVLSISVEQYFYWAERDLAAEIVRIQNEKLTEVTAAYPDRFVPLGAVALQYPDLAAEQLEHAVKNLGHRGCMITCSIDGHELSDPRFHPFWAKAEDLNVIVFIHPKGFVQSGSRLEGRGYLRNVIGNPLETAVALSHLIYEGTLDRFPGLKIVAAHGGGYLPSYIGRFDHGHSSNDHGGRGAEAKKPSDYLGRLYFDTLVYSTENLAHLIETCGVSQIVLGTDHPFGMMNQNPIAHLLSVPGLSEADIESILNGTIKELLKLDV